MGDNSCAAALPTGAYACVCVHAPSRVSCLRVCVGCGVLVWSRARARVCVCVWCACGVLVLRSECGVFVWLCVCVCVWCACGVFTHA